VLPFDDVSANPSPFPAAAVVLLLLLLLLRCCH
jgi:hypothetical protein